MENSLKDKTILVTGGTGSIGSEIVRRVLERGAKKVVVISRDEIKHFILRRRIQDERLENVIGDTRDPVSVEKIFYSFQVDYVYHAAAMKHVVMCEEFPLQAVETNVIGTQNIINLALKYKVPKMITVSTDKAAYPINVLGASKLIAETMTLNANALAAPGQAFCCVRFGNVAISRGSVIPLFVDNLLSHKPIMVTDYDVTRFIMGIPEATQLVVSASEQAQGGEIFILHMRAFRLGDLVDVVLNRIAPRFDIPRSEIEVRVTGLLKGEKHDENLINEREAHHFYRLDDLFVILPDDGMAARYPGIEKVTLPEYTSKNVPLVSKDEIEVLILNYLQNYLAIGRS